MVSPTATSPWHQKGHGLCQCRGSCKYQVAGGRGGAWGAVLHRKNGVPGRHEGQLHVFSCLCSPSTSFPSSSNYSNSPKLLAPARRPLSSVLLLSVGLLQRRPPPATPEHMTLAVASPWQGHPCSRSQTPCHLLFPSHRPTTFSGKPLPSPSPAGPVCLWLIFSGLLIPIEPATLLADLAYFLLLPLECEHREDRYF